MKMNKNGMLKRMLTVIFVSILVISFAACGNQTVKEEDETATKFPSFDGKDLDGNVVNSNDLFSNNVVTVVNFWFTTCTPCVEELGDLEALDTELQEKGGSLVGINAFTLDGDKKSIAEAKATLLKKGANYQNIYFPSDSEAGEFTSNIMAFPTTYVVDRNGKIVGDPLMGAINNEKQREILQGLIDEAIEKDGN